MKAYKEMKVKELIAILEKFDSNLGIMVNYTDSIQCIVKCNEQIYVDVDYGTGDVEYINIVTTDWSSMNK